MSGFDNIGLCLFEVKLMGGLAFMTNFQKTMNPYGINKSSI